MTDCESEDKDCDEVIGLCATVQDAVSLEVWLLSAQLPVKQSD